MADGGRGKRDRCTPAKGCVGLEYVDATMARVGEDFGFGGEWGIRKNTQKVSPVSQSAENHGHKANSFWRASHVSQGRDDVDVHRGGEVRGY